ncbi:alpha/beta fold hydrolase [Ideonella livida]|uniref:Alpha/beta hydrolase n=1 Tax=Ideonella livida TaxID=2707176 RepID=A0A7C9PEL0_9BURK|nr:alpha/beta hydrolase [Ideonella livida]NDY89936.1 alpha/beta hydrolase [Ideonella livida]
MDTLSHAPLRVGHGPHPVFFLPGWLGPDLSWGELHRWIDGQSFTAVFFEPRGMGARLQEEGDHSIVEMAWDVLALADELGWPEFSLVGHDMGAMVAQRVLMEAPERVFRLVGVCPVPASGFPLDAGSQACFMQAADDLQVRRALLDLLTANRLPGTWLDQQVQHSALQLQPEAFLGYVQAWTGQDFAVVVEGAPHPMLALVGAHDPALTEAFVRETWMEAFPHAHIRILPSASHYPAHETPLHLVQVIERFLSAGR